jgi:hypothetical protein
MRNRSKRRLPKPGIEGMQVPSQSNEMRAIGPDGQPFSLDDLPPPGTKRWVVRRKAQVVAGVRGGLLSLEDACQRYTLSVEEFASWQQLIDRHGLRGLRVTRLQDYRSPKRSANGPNGGAPRPAAASPR